MSGFVRVVLCAAAGASLAFTSACEDRQALHEPDPSLGRMLDQPRTDPWETPMAAPPDDTVPRDEGPGFADEPPATAELLRIGRTRFEVVCATCHGDLGDGNSVVAAKMELRKPPSLHEPRIRALSHRDVFDVITRGYGLMPGFPHELTPRDRWAVADYLDALRLARGAEVAQLPPDVRAELERSAAP